MRTQQHQQQGAFVAREAFPCKAEAVGPARDWATEVLRQAGGTELQAETCTLLVSELATNAVLHAEGECFEVTVWPGCTVDVKDGSQKAPENRFPGESEEGGRGLILVTLLAREYKVILTDDGKISRFRL
ncbi:ATP-binding protein [Streptomyces sp. NPDC006265]|uniref:ATP-binding protein n=1 Tax=Streptomyces sp. NPDC006265 TaxID=3156740 RepID=UPI0033A1A287